MTLRLGDTFPNLSVETTKGAFQLYDYFGDKFALEHACQPR